MGHLYLFKKRLLAVCRDSLCPTVEVKGSPQRNDLTSSSSSSKGKEREWVMIVPLNNPCLLPNKDTIKDNLLSSLFPCPFSLIFLFLCYLFPSFSTTYCQVNELIFFFLGHVSLTIFIKYFFFIKTIGFIVYNILRS